MNHKTNTMNGFIVLLLIASVTLNLCFFAGCRSLHDAVYGNPCKFGSDAAPVINDSGKAVLVSIAGKLGVRSSGTTVSGLADAICGKLDHSKDVPSAFDAAAFEKMLKDLRVEEREAMCKYQEFISDLQGKRVIVIEPEE